MLVGREGYLFRNEDAEAGDRFDALATLFDPWSRDHLARLGVAEGWRCLEIGAGGGTIAAWLADQVGSTGHVLATDLDVRWLSGRFNAAHVEVRTHDIATDPLPESAFDAIHERLVLVHVPEREAVLHRLVTSLKPGGWLLSETFDAEFGTNPWLPEGDPDDTGHRLVMGIQALLRDRGAEGTLGRRMPGLLRAAGLADVGADGYRILDGGEAPRRLFRANILQSAEELVRQGLVDADDLEEYVTRLDAGAVRASTPMLVSTWGRRPPEG
jgi:SAM-dependent methyltransferase